MDRIRAFFEQIKEGLTNWDDVDDFDLEEAPREVVDLSRDEELDLSFEERLLRRRRVKQIGVGLAVAFVVVAVVGFFTYNKVHTFTDYAVSVSIENSMTSGTSYEAVGKYLYRYNADGVSCITKSNETKWSITYSMQSPMVDVCGTTMVIAEQQGTQVYVINEEGLVGSFTTLLPILKVRVSNQGVVAVVLKDDDVTWVNLYDSEGESIATDKTTITDSGYPLDIDISPNGEKLVVSYLGILQGVMTSTINFYDFGSGGDSDADYICSTQTVQGASVPEVYFVNNTTCVAVADDGFYVFSGSTPSLTAQVDIAVEIMACFHDEDCIGFLLSDSAGDNDYVMEIYNYKGNCRVSTGIDVDYENIKVENGKILMYTATKLTVYTKSGRLKLTCTYEKEITDVFYFGGYRRYYVITKDDIERIRIY